ncbi:MAG TPA: Uma2 family endonuclease [Burkholderiaceae bacterium]|nr:Uma2 family endonuclease [Burkholderiaceae bacterium]
MHAEIEVGEDVDLVTLWRQLLADPTAPERCELTEHGEIVVSPLPTNRHQRLVGRVAAQILSQLGGDALGNVAILTSMGIRCPDLAWLPAEQYGDSPLPDPLTSAPPLLVEVLSPGNRKVVIAQKIRAFLEAGATEVIVIGLDGKTSFHRADGAHAESAFGVKFELPAALFA